MRRQQAHGVASTVVVTVVNAKGAPLKGAAVRLSGAGVKTKPKRTSKKGIATFVIKPTRVGTLTATNHTSAACDLLVKPTIAPLGTNGKELISDYRVYIDLAPVFAG